MKAKARIEVLDLSDNASGPIGVNGISEFIKSSSCYTLKELRLNNMGLGITGAQVFCLYFQLINTFYCDFIFMQGVIT